MKDLLLKTREHFSRNYSYVHIDQLTDIDLASILSASHMQFRGDGSPIPFSNKMDMLYDYLLSQGIVDATE